MFNKVMKKVAASVVSATMMLGATVACPLISTSIYAQWPDPGYNHIPAEDRTFSTNDAAFEYANNNASAIAKNYHMNIEFEVRYDGPGKYTSVFYGYGYTGGSEAPCVTPSTPSGAYSKTVKTKGTVTGDGLRVRMGPGTEYTTTSFSPVNAGQQLDICDTAYDTGGGLWYYICLNGKYGFVYAQYVQTIPDVAPAEDASAAPADDTVMACFTAKVLVDELNVRSGAGASNKKVALSPLTKDMIVNVTAAKDDNQGRTWYQIEVKGMTGWICGDYIEGISQQYVGDVEADSIEKNYIGSKTRLVDETRFFDNEQAALNWALSATTGSKMYSKYGVTTYFYVADVAPSWSVVHWYK